MSSIATRIIGEDDELRRLARSGLGLPTKLMSVALRFLAHLPEYEGRATGILMFSSKNLHPVYVRSEHGVQRLYWRASLQWVYDKWVLTFQTWSHFERFDEGYKSSTPDQAHKHVLADARRFVDVFNSYLTLGKVYWPEQPPLAAMS